MEPTHEAEREKQSASESRGGIQGFLQTILGQSLILLIGAAIGVVFTIMVAYPALLAQSRENEARIEANKEQIERLLEAHEITHNEQRGNEEEKP